LNEREGWKVRKKGIFRERTYVEVAADYALLLRVEVVSLN
jgi:hypothetical protein